VTVSVVIARCSSERSTQEKPLGLLPTLSPEKPWKQPATRRHITATEVKRSYPTNPTCPFVDSLIYPARHLREMDEDITVQGLAM